MNNTITQTHWKVSKSSITFKIKNFGFNVDGYFKGFESDIIFDENNLSESSIQASVEAKTINTNNIIRDTHLRQDDYFGVGKYPQITMQSTQLTNQSQNQFLGIFELSLKGKTQNIEVPFTFEQNDNKATIQGAFEINRLDFGIGSASFVLNNIASLKIKVELEK